MRPWVAFTLLFALGAALVLCDIEAIATARRWNPQDMGRTPTLSFELARRHNLQLQPGTQITIRVDTPYDVRVYRYKLSPGDRRLPVILHPISSQMPAAREHMLAQGRAAQLSAPTRNP